MTSLIITEQKSRLSLTKKAGAILVTLASAVVLPQLFHIVGNASGFGTKLGIAFSPMHLPILLAGFIAGPTVGCCAGALSPLVSHLLSGMPVASQVPFMTIELLGYGLVAGLLRYVKMPTTVKVLLTQIAGRVLYMGFAAFCVYALKNDQTAVMGIWKNVPFALPGLILQITFLPLLVYRIENLGNQN